MSKQLIASSYNDIAQKYHDWAAPRPTTDRAAYISQLATLLPRNAQVLELGCGSGVPATQSLVQLGYTVTGVDVSSSLIDIARREVPGATFHVSDMLSFRPADAQMYDCIVAFYTLWHLPPDEQDELLRKAVKEWLKPGGWILFNLMTEEGELRMEEWMGRPMVSWGLGVEGNKRMVGKLVDESLIMKQGREGEIRMEKVGRHEQGMHWFLLQKV